MAGGRPVVPGAEKMFGAALRAEIAAAGMEEGNGRHGTYKALRLIARNLLEMAQVKDLAALPAIREIGDRLDGKPKQETEVSLRTAVARELTDDDLAALAVGASLANEQLKKDPKPDSTPLN